MTLGYQKDGITLGSLSPKIVGQWLSAAKNYGTTVDHCRRNMKGEK